MLHQCNATVAGLLDAHLRDSGKTQVALEVETGITDTHIARIRAGKLPGKWTIPPLAKALGLSAEALTALVARERKARLVGGGRGRGVVAGGHGRSSRRKSATAAGAKVRQ